MSIRPSYRKRSVVQVLADGMAVHPPTGRSCCEEAQLNANEVKAKHDLWLAELKRAEHALSELARRNEELAEAEGEIAALTKRAETAEARRSELIEAGNEHRLNIMDLTERIKGMTAERDEARGSRDYWIDLYGELRDELQAKLDAAENRPTLDRDAVKRIVVRESHGSMTDRMDDALTDAIMALALADAIEAGEAQRNDDVQRIEEQAKALFRTLHPLSNWEENVHTHGRFRAAIRDGWPKEADK